MKKKIRDERVEESKLKVYKEALYVLIVVLLISLFDKSFVLKQGIESYIDELVGLIAVIIYIILRNLWLGNLVNISETINRKVILLSTVLCSVALTTRFAVNNYISYMDKYTGIFDWLFWASIMIMFVQMFVICGIGFYVLGKKELKNNRMED